MATIYDIARTAGTSPATVSRVLNGRTGVKTDTARRIREAMEEVNFQPRWKAMERNRFLVLIPSAQGILNSGYVTRILSGMADSAFRMGFNLVLRPFDTAHCNYRELRQLIVQEGAAGCFLISLNDIYLPTSDINLIGLPHVVVGHKFQDDGLHQILFDDYHAGIDATQYLLALGHRNIALVSFDISDRGHRDIHRGFMETMRGAGFESHAQHVQFRDSLPESGRSAALRLLQPRERPTAVIISNEDLANGFLAETRAMGLDIPRDVSVIAFENAYSFDMTSPALTAMQTPVYASGVEAVKMLCAQMKQDHGGYAPTRSDPNTITLPIPLVVRHSTIARPQA
ncbi:MAG: hypothetical protein B9S32_02185 [Verrucomicrobia bacterium Tous-C9LFEB]|nr:MAG: hypothetical protein B9S32_02185 [Verrucomicrobia bacterium Tous-C9LFEB]